MRNFLRRPEPILDYTCPDHIKMGFGNLEDCRRFGNMPQSELYALRLHGSNGFLEICQLLFRIALVPAVSRGKMGEHALNHYIGQLCNLGSQCANFLFAHTDTPHASIHFQMNLNLLALRRCRCR